MQINYANHGRYGVAVIKAPKILGYRLGYLSMQSDESWAIRDYIGGVMLRSGGGVSTAVSGKELTLKEIESVVDDSWSDVPQRSVGRMNEWTADLEFRSKNIFGKNYDAHTPPSDSWGRWRPLR